MLEGGDAPGGGGRVGNDDPPEGGAGGPPRGGPGGPFEAEAARAAAKAAPGNNCP